MKTLSSILVLSFVMLVGCTTSENTNPTKPVVTQGTGNGILYGTVVQSGFVNKFSNLVWDTKQSGVKVEVVGTQILTETDGYGEFKLRGLDSGVYSVRFSKLGYETLQLDYIQSNGNDSTAIMLKITDSTGKERTYEAVFLSELPPTIEATNAIANAAEEIWADTLLGTTTIRYDTTYSFEASFSVNLQSIIRETQDSLDAGCLVRITNRSTVESSEMPTAFYAGNTTLTNGWLGYYGSTYKSKPVYTGTRDFTLARNASKEFRGDVPITLESFSRIGNYQVKKSEQLYLHIIPVAKEFKRIQHSNRFSTWLTFDVLYKFGALKTIPIQWK